MADGYSHIICSTSTCDIVWLVSHTYYHKHFVAEFYSYFYFYKNMRHFVFSLTTHNITISTSRKMAALVYISTSTRDISRYF